ncbi:MAG: polysaccharide biosynthesis protein [Ruminococcaceae bacterium]|nr:polysaccharide biosynthesis protein [Oscillospiraceae bacterium]
MSKTKQTFVHGALILMLSNIIVKAGGALFKIPLSNTIGDEAMGYFGTAYAIYSVCFLISTAGLPVAISRMVSASLAQKKRGEAERIYQVSLLLFMIIGALGTAVLFFGAKTLANLTDEPELAVCIQVVSPIMFFICLVSCTRGYFQGNQNMIPTAISQVIEVAGKLGLGLAAGIFASRQGYAPNKVAAFALCGVTIGVVLSAVYMSFAKTVAKRDREVGLDTAKRTKGDIAKELIAIAIPITISSSIMSLTSVIDSLVAVKRLNDTCVGIHYFSEKSKLAMAIYGAYSSKAITLFNLPTTIIQPFAISIIPAISGAGAKNNREEMKKSIDFTFRIVGVIALPCAFGMGVMAKPIISLLFSGNGTLFTNKAGDAFLSNDVAGTMLSILAPAIAFAGLITVSAAVLQASGHEKKSILSTFCGVVTKALSIWILIGVPGIGHLGIPLSTLLCYTVMFLFNMFFLSHYLKYRLNFRTTLMIPLIAAAVCGAVAGGVYLLLASFSAKIATLIAIACAGLVYVVVLFRCGGFKKDDVLQLPKGDTIYRLLVKVHLLKA